VVAMSDGIENYSSFDQRLQALRQSSANGTAMELLRLGNIAAADDRSAVVAEVVQTKTAEAFSVEETSAISAVEAVVGLEMTSGILDGKKLKKDFLMARLTFSKLPQASRVRREIMTGVVSQLGAEGERLKKAGKPEAEIFDEWLKQVFIPLYRRTKTK
ncbi:MAG: hypothetical protein U0946_06130, partial [Patescibacteria group bacterium]|nr:hypothetical protein [Patescibacteria group bacterium]